jgi:Flp pilus assembly CpaE family ATPase
MIKKILTVLLIEDSPEYAELVHRWLSPRNDIEFVLNWTDSLSAGLARLARGGVDVILLDLGLPDSQGLETFVTAKTNSSGVPIVILSGGDTESLAVQMVQRGAQDYIIKCTCNSELLATALQFAVVRSTAKASSEVASDQRTMIGVMGAKGGVGATTFACNLAIELRRQTDQSTLLADLDLNAGLVSFLMNTDAKYSILDAAANIHRLDLSFWGGIVARGPGGVDIARSPNLFGFADSDAPRIQNVLTTIRAFYRWTVLDLGRMTSLSLSLLDNVAEIYLVTMANVPALYEAKRTIAALMKTGLEAHRLRLIVNQVRSTPEFTGNELGQLFGIPIYAKLPEAAHELHEACTQRKLLGGNSDYRADVARLARKIAALPEEASGGAVAHLLSFAGRFRKSNKDIGVASQV